MVLDRPPGRVLKAGEDEVGHRPALERGGPLDETFLLRGHARLQPFAA